MTIHSILYHWIISLTVVDTFWLRLNYGTKIHLNKRSCDLCSVREQILLLEPINFIQRVLVLCSGLVQEATLAQDLPHFYAVISIAEDLRCAILWRQWRLIEERSTLSMPLLLLSTRVLLTSSWLGLPVWMQRLATLEAQVKYFCWSDVVIGISQLI